MKRILIAGAGPCGLGAAWRLHELGATDWAILEKADQVGGLASSTTDEHGFTWDVGGHVIFSQDGRFNGLVDRLLGDALLEHERSSWVRLAGCDVPYPFQNNIGRLPTEQALDCMWGLIQAQLNGAGHKPRNFEEWVRARFGCGIGDLFMLPYNRKVWAHALADMSFDWIAERVSVPDAKEVLRNFLAHRNDSAWGPNHTFKFPLTGGTGALAEAFVPHIQPHLRLGQDIVAVDAERKQVTLDSGEQLGYDALIATGPLVDLVAMCPQANERLGHLLPKLQYCSCLIVGIGLDRPGDKGRTWVYFPESNSPFYRVTYFSNYSPNNVPGPGCCSFICETSYSGYRPIDRDAIVEQTLQGLIATNVMDESDRERIASVRVMDVKYSYPVPTLGRDDALKPIMDFFHSHDVLPRGRFGTWRYEIGNTDHATLMGMEAVDRLLSGTPEKVLAE